MKHSDHVECHCTSRDNVTREVVLTPDTCYAIAPLLADQLYFVTCTSLQSPYPDMSPQHHAFMADTDKMMVDNIKVGLNIIVVLVVLVIFLLLMIVVLRKYWRAQYNTID